MQQPLLNWILVKIFLVVILSTSAQAFARPPQDIPCGLVLYNGKIATMDHRGTLASSVAIRNDRITAVAAGAKSAKHSDCAQMIDLRGHLVIPGLIESHDHFVILSMRPGYDTRLETSTSIAEVQQVIRRRAKEIPAQKWITAIGGWDPVQFAEKRLPTLAELDVAAPNHPVFLYVGQAGPSSTNSLGKEFFQNKGITVGPDGSIAANAPSIAALSMLRTIQTFEDQKRGALDAMAYSASVGLTMHDDQAGGWPPVHWEPGSSFGSIPRWKGLVEVTNGTASTLDPFSGYDALLELHREGKLSVRLRLFLYTRDLQPDLPFLNQRLDYQWRDFGDDWMKISGLGEWISSGDLRNPPPIYEAAARLVAQKGWSYQQHASGLQDERAITSVWEKVNETVPLSGLRWCLAHVPGIDQQTIDRLKAIGVGVNAGGRIGYMEGRIGEKGPPFRMLVDSSIHVGFGGDGGSLAPLDPWLHIYYMVTGKNSAGEVIARGQTISRLEALRLYTIENAWFTHDEDKLGSIEIGKLADLVVLSDDFLNPARVPNESIKRLSSVLTIVGGKIVYDTGVLRSRSLGKRLARHNGERSPA